MTMKKSMLICTILGALGFVGSASANLASHTFTWSGSVPTSPSQNGWIIKSPTAGDIGAGILVFTADASGKGNLQSSTDLAFNVFEYGNAPTVGEPASNYTYKLTSLAVNTDGLAQEQYADGYFSVKADGALLVKGDAVSKPTGGDTILTVVPSGVQAPANQPVAGNDVDVQAVIMVTTATL